MNLPGGQHIVKALTRHGVDALFTLSGGHVFPIYDGAVKEDVRLIDVRHEQTAAFAAEAVGKLTGRPGVAVVTAGPGVTNTVSAVTAAYENGSPLVVIGGRAPAFRWGQGSLQEFDHIPLMAPITKHAATISDQADAVDVVDHAWALSSTPKQGPVFIDAGIDVQVSPAEIDYPDIDPPLQSAPDPALIESIAGLIESAERPVIVAGSAVQLAGAHVDIRQIAEKGAIPVFANGLGRGTLAPTHPMAFSRARSVAFKSADLVVVVGTPLDFRLGFGQFGSAKVVHIVDHAAGVADHVDIAAAAVGDLPGVLAALAETISDADRNDWVETLRTAEHVKRLEDRDLMATDGVPLHPARIYHDLLPLLDNDTVVIGDGGDFVSFAGRFIDSPQPGRWLDPGPFGCLGSGPGYALGAAIAAPESSIVLLAGDGAFGFAGIEIDTLVRHGIDVTVIIGNNGIWGLEKHPMQAFYGYDVAADLQTGTRYDQLAESLGAKGHFVTSPEQLRPALEESLSAAGVSVVNVLTDPAIAYPRSANLM
ncbi:MAG: acetolactate synthase [Acidimicrobiia bacterium]|nr:acetolactate synthase [Acidimicrobiia bacterium]